MSPAKVEWFDAKPVTGTARVVQLALLIMVTAVIGPIGLGLVAVDGSIEFVITPNELIVHVAPGFFASKRRVSHDDILSVRLDRQPYNGRTYGTAKPGHCCGWFVRGRLGKVWEASTCTSHDTVVVRIRDETWTLGPADREGFARALQLRQPGAWRPPPAPPSPWWWRLLKLVMIALVAVPLFMLAAILTPIRYGVGDAQLWVRGPFGTRRFRLRGSVAQYVDSLAIGFKVFGMGMPGAWFGLFRVDGKTTRVYATRSGGDGVLLDEPKRVLITPAEPHRLLDALSRSGARTDRLPRGRQGGPHRSPQSAPAS